MSEHLGERVQIVGLSFDKHVFAHQTAHSRLGLAHGTLPVQCMPLAGRSLWTSQSTPHRILEPSTNCSVCASNSIGLKSRPFAATAKSLSRIRTLSWIALQRPYSVTASSRNRWSRSARPARLSTSRSSSPYSALGQQSRHFLRRLRPVS